MIPCMATHLVNSNIINNIINNDDADGGGGRVLLIDTTVWFQFTGTH